MQILLIEDEKKISNFLKKGLTSEGHSVFLSDNGEDGLYHAENTPTDLIILDLMLPRMDGLTVCRALRKKGSAIPIIMLTAKDTIEDRVKGLDAGADDYLLKPFSLAELSARIRALSRRKQSQGSLGSNTVAVGDLSLNLDTHEVQRGKKAIELSATEFKLLQYLAEHQHRIVTRSMILEAVWGYDFDPASNIVEVYIKYLRDKIDKEFTKKLIKTIHGTGYRLCDSE